LKHDNLDKRVSAYVDGALRGTKRDQLEREMELDERLARQVSRSRALGRAVRESWNEGPAAPAPEFLLAAIRPALHEIDRERRAQPAWKRSLESAFARLGAALRPSPVLAAAAAFAFFAALAVVPRIDGTQGLLQGNLASPPAPAADAAGSSYSSYTGSSSSTNLGIGPFGTMPTDFSAEGSGSVYDVSPGRPAMLFRGKDGSVTLWLIDQGDLSYRIGAGGWG